MSAHRKTRVRTIVLLATLAAAVSVLTGCAGSSGATAGKEVTTIRYQSGVGTVNPLELADALGYLDGLELEKVGDVTGGPQGLQALASNQTDIGASAFYGAIAQLVGTGVPIKAVVPTYGSTDELWQVVATVEGSGIADARDLIGKKIAVNTLGANAEAVLDTWFDQEGLTEEEQDRITLVPLPPLNTPQALKEGQVDAASLSFTSLEVAKRTVKLKTLVRDIDVVGHTYGGGGFTLREEFIERNPTTTRTLVEGIAKAVNFIETHEKQEIYDVYFPWLTEHGHADYIEPIEANFPGTLGLPAEPVIGDGDISLWLDWLESRGDVDADAIQPSDVYTNDFNPYA
ncbi:MAG TPA: ABC transporter substrate-binding protein [Nocardioides sp.]|uniref:ABC transporter substrate-binding protein n=1 Tax=Nocardioides sp. TaxID=35761 RepID=UPI002EDA2665